MRKKRVRKREGKTTLTRQKEVTFRDKKERKREYRKITLQGMATIRWTVRTSALHAILKQYESVLTALEEMASCGTNDTSIKANGFHEKFLKGNTMLGLVMAEDIIGDLECLNTSLQLKQQTVSGTLEAVKHVKKSMQEKRTDEHFQQLFTKASDLVTKLDLQLIQMPHIREQAKRYSSQTAPDGNPNDPNVQSYFRPQYYSCLDMVNTQMTQRFDQDGIQKLQKLENVLLKAALDKVLDEYPELNSRQLQVQLNMFEAMYTFQTTADVAENIQNMVPEVRGPFSQVETLVRLLLVVPASSSEAESSFSALRRLKTWLRSSMSQTRLNNVAICHVHQQRLDKLELLKVCQSFIQVNEKHKKIFGSFIENLVKTT
ncbi:uncharacterized protein LOC131534415 [Onychostoma macrolepis]|uniref:uncharacterized protein LOC131534415 n=1 Tax=Onychostoma macrolepis TaxID=369639 RepID=UPI00272CEBC3|nr:uncharacterized protein LOC131534415 [Onychostoma macrolepis]XP_058623255.1 uncharacterized protein LOC131534415 [Onychostoma macrolepis]XP_058623256.1 uncharacterized protein LOC131534415 [Onychostoma macrolepis]